MGSFAAGGESIQIGDVTPDVGVAKVTLARSSVWFQCIPESSLTVEAWSASMSCSFIRGEIGRGIRFLRPKDNISTTILNYEVYFGETHRLIPRICDQRKGSIQSLSARFVPETAVEFQQRLSNCLLGHI